MTSNRFEKYAIHALMISIAGLLLLNIFLIYRNSRVIELNKQLQEEAEKTKVNTLDIIRTIHQIDMGLRAYALIGSEVQYKVVTDGYPRLDTIFINLRRSLQKQNFPMQSLQTLEDSTYQYLDTINVMVDMLHANNLEGFKDLLRRDLGFFTYKSYLHFSGIVNAFEDNIAANAKVRYNRALENSYWLQIALFLITVPALMIMMRLFDRNVKISRKLGEAERATINLLASQKEDLEHQVAARTNDIVVQNREIIAQNEEIRQHNEQIMLHQKEIDRQRLDVLDKNEKLQQAYETIERQNLIIQQKNRELMAEVDHQTQYLRMKNQELAEQNARLEQFAYIISHNLRAPMARLVGLASVLRKSGDEVEKSDIIDLMVRSTGRLRRGVQGSVNDSEYTKVESCRILYDTAGSGYSESNESTFLRSERDQRGSQDRLFRSSLTSFPASVRGEHFLQSNQQFNQVQKSGTRTGYQCSLPTRERNYPDYFFRQWPGYRSEQAPGYGIQSVQALSLSCRRQRSRTLPGKNTGRSIGRNDTDRK
ncbi:MAG: hypothetical protein QM762_18805 [Chryseolinea sp.]